MLIHVTLPPWPSRSTPGILRLYSGTDPGVILRTAKSYKTPLYQCPCLGQSDHYMAAKHGNSTGNPLLPFGDTPTGSYLCTYTDTISMPGYDSAHFLHSYGPNGIISMQGVGGDALKAYTGPPARSGIDIHGGDPILGTLIGLRVTDGCLRVANVDMKGIAGFVKDAMEPLMCLVEETAS